MSDQARHDLVLAIRMLEHSGIMDYNGHASIRLNADRFLINVGNCPRSVISGSDICTIDDKGNVLEGEGKPPLEFHLHLGLYRARPDIGAIVHAHPRWSTYLSMTANAYRPVFAQGAILGPVPVLDTPQSINNPEIAARLVEVLGDNPAALMKSHGAVAVGSDIVEAFVLANYLEENAERQYMAMQIGQPFVFDQVEIEAARAKLWNRGLFERTWAHFRAKLPEV